MTDTLTLRDQLAAAALVALGGHMAAEPTWAIEDIAAQAYRLADAMLIARGVAPPADATDTLSHLGALTEGLGNLAAVVAKLDASSHAKAAAMNAHVAVGYLRNLTGPIDEIAGERIDR